ncbi:ABC transporter permease [Bacillus sp. SG-1]|uniref:ABC transporter permease n=1 Tax=Bacillus sp. SG-1 TaxID=161544 RepID=UPI0002F87B9A|nr:ABC transporter permease [Bacillus sp. SG-1]
MSSLHLFFKRIRNSFLFQYNVIKSVADWTVMLYLIVPSAVIGTMIYRSWWMEIPEWIVPLPFELFFLIPFFYILTGYFRTCLLEADQVFLTKHPKILLGLKKWGVFSSYGNTLLFTAAIGLLIAPFWLLHFNAGIMSLLSFLTFILSSKWSHMAVKGILVGLRKNWKRTLLFYLAIIMQLQMWGIAYRLIDHGQYMILALVNTLLIASSFLINRKRIYSKNSMQRDLRIENKLKMKWIRLIFMFSHQVEKEPVSAERNRPRLLRKSQPIFKKRTPFHGYLELFVKVLIRNFQYSATYFQSIGALSFSQIVLPALWLKLGAAGLIALSLLAWNEWVWDKLIIKHPIGSKYSNKRELRKVQNTTRIVAFIPYFFMLTFSLLSHFGVI